VVRKVTFLALIAFWGAISAQPRQEPGKPIGSVSTRNGLIVLTLDDGALGKANPFDLEGRTLRFIPESGGYRVENLPLVWESEFGPEMPGPQATLRNFKFPSQEGRGTSFRSASPDRSVSAKTDPIKAGAGAALPSADSTSCN
jgi:hypothetical protein